MSSTPSWGWTRAVARSKGSAPTDCRITEPSVALTMVWLAADASGAERAGVRVDFLECAGERFDVGVGEVAGEVLLDAVAVVPACTLHRPASFVGQHDEDRAAVVLGADAAHEVGSLEPVNHAGE